MTRNLSGGQFKKVAPGIYYHPAHPEYDPDDPQDTRRYRIEQAPDGRRWDLTYPDQHHPDDFFPTLREAKEEALYHKEHPGDPE